jgi:predicted lipid-binding transport protein (Tim44 family)
MSSPIIQLIVLAAIAIFLILRLRDVLGTREGFEKPAVSRNESERIDNRNRFEVIEGGPDTDITDHIDDPDSVEALTQMKKAEPSFGVSDFLGGARGAYEMILMAFEAGDLAKIKPFLSDEVYESFATVVEQREKDGYKIEANFVGLR